MERTAVWILVDVTSFVVDDRLHQGGKFFIFAKERMIMCKLSDSSSEGDIGVSPVRAIYLICCITQPLSTAVIEE